MVEDPLQIGRLRTAFLRGQISASELIERVLTRIAKWDDPALWITRTSDTALRQRAFELDEAAAADPDSIKRLPLFGIPFAVKDNIDVAGPADHGRLSGIRLYPIGNRPWLCG